MPSERIGPFCVLGNGHSCGTTSTPVETMYDIFVCIWLLIPLLILGSLKAICDGGDWSQREEKWKDALWGFLLSSPFTLVLLVSCALWLKSNSVSGDVAEKVWLALLVAGLPVAIGALVGIGIGLYLFLQFAVHATTARS
mmetsp:Transcript_109455/g.341058  ORF Transcript_109455/g.341058 Transcript_109455/m.341058 type:complete len:140 (+) Transcript_109455:509-928(+)